MKKQRLELTWVGKDERIKLEPRVLVEEPDRSYGDKNTDNMLIYGDNLLSLKALEQEFAGKVKCIFIDPPYNTGSAFEHYDDGVEHSIWLSLMRDRLELIKRLLCIDGSLWITIDDNEAHYLKVLCDEVFGRHNFISNIIWEKADSPRMDAKYFSSRHDHILAYAKQIEYMNVNKIENDSNEAPDHYSKTDSNGRKYYLKPLRAMGKDGKREARPTMFYSITAPDGSEVFPKNPDGSDSRWRWSPDRLEKDKEKIEWVTGRNGWSVYFRIYADDNDVRPPETIWFNSDVGSNRTSKFEIKAIFGEDVFDTPKPEKLLKRVIEIATNPGDLVLDSFAGSGTTGAVAHKIGRRWIMVELGDHCHTHIIPRLTKVINGEDKGGITEAVNWQGGGGFKYYRLAESLLVKDKDLSTENNPVYIINPRYNDELLIKSICKIENFRYRNDGRLHGISSENRFLHITTRLLTQVYLESLAEDISKDQSLLIYCTRKSRNLRLPENVEIKKIPKNLLEKCDFEEEKK